MNVPKQIMEVCIRKETHMRKFVSYAAVLVLGVYIGRLQAEKNK